MQSEKLNAQQKLRRHLLIRCLKVGTDPERALSAARRMVTFVLGRRPARPAASTAAERPSGRPRHGEGHAASSPQTAPTGRSRWRRRRSRGTERADERQKPSAPAKRPVVRQSPEEIKAMADAYLAKHGPTREPVTLESVIRFMRSRDYVVVDKDNGTFELDSRHVLTADQLVERANVVRRRMGKPCFPESVLQSR